MENFFDVDFWGLVVVLIIILPIPWLIWGWLLGDQNKKRTVWGIVGGAGLMTMGAMWLLDKMELLESCDFEKAVIITIAMNAIFAFFCYGIKDGSSVKCPECGTWNEYDSLEILGQHEYSRWETHERDVKDNKGNKVGTYESRELHTYRTTTEKLKCKACGHEFEQDFTKEV